MKCLVTGGMGFIGSHLVELLIEKGHSVTILDDLSTGSLDNLKLDKGYEFVQGSVLNKGLVKDLVKQADHIYHLAAVVGVKEAFNNPLHALKTNIEGTEIILDLTFAYGKKVLVVSSSEVYGYGSKSKLKETDPGVIGSGVKSLRWAYGVSKLVDEFFALSYYQKHHLPLVIVRPFNVVGPRQTGFYGMVLPRFVEQALNDKPLTVYGNGKQTRCFAYVTEVAEVFYELMQSDKAIGNVFNVAGNMEISMLELAQKVKKVIGSQSAIHFIPYEEAYGPNFDDAMHRYADTSFLKKCLGWTPTMSIEEMIRRTVKWKTSLSQ